MPSLCIKTPRLTLTPITENDWPLFFKLNTDPKVIELCFAPKTEQQVREKFDARLQPWVEGSASWLTLVIRDIETQQPIGVTGFFTTEDGAHEVGYLLLAEHHGKQYGTESLAALLDWAAREHQIGEFQAVVTAGNIASERVLIKCGFWLDEVVENAYQIGGRVYDDHIFRWRAPSTNA